MIIPPTSPGSASRVGSTSIWRRDLIRRSMPLTQSLLLVAQDGLREQGRVKGRRTRNECGQKRAQTCADAGGLVETRSGTSAEARLTLPPDTLVLVSPDPPKVRGTDDEVPAPASRSWASIWLGELPRVARSGTALAGPVALP